MQLTFEIPGEAFGRNGVEAIRKCMREVVTRVAQDLRTNILRQTSTDLKVRSSSLLKSWSGAPKIEERGDDVSATLASSIVYAAIHEFGGTIVPKQAQDLYIPVLPSLKNATQTRSVVRPREVYQNPSIIGMAGLFKSKSGRALMGVPGRGMPPVVVYALAKEVVIPPRRYLTHAMETTAARAPETVALAVEKAFARMGL